MDEKAIRKLEGHAGLPLFEQLGKKIYLTAAGTELQHHCHLIIRQFEEAEAVLEHASLAPRARSEMLRRVLLR